MVATAALLVPLLAGPVVNSVVQILISLGKDEFISACGVKGDVEKLKSHLKRIQAALEDLEEQQYDSKTLRDWLSKLIVAARDAEDLLDEFATEAALWSRKNRHLRKFHVISNRLKVQKEIKKVLKEFEKIAEERSKFKPPCQLVVNVGGVFQNYPQTTSEFVGTREILGREEEKEKIIGMLQSENTDKEGNVSIIPIVGMPGVGKTALAQHVYNDERVEECFELSRMWVCVNVEFNLTRILKEIMESYSKMPLPNDLTPSQVELRFRDFLPGKRFLLVLDDVWNVEYKQWFNLLECLKLGKMGSKVLVTSRSQMVTKKIGTQSPICLECLSENDCWSIFEAIAFSNVVHVSDRLRKALEDIGRGIVAKCNGLPLAVEQMGGLLRGNVNVDKWERIRESNLWELSESDSTNIIPALKLSYTHLPPYLKQCFSFCSIFPKAYVFHKKELVKLWMAAAFIHSDGQLNSIEKRGGEYFDELLGRFFFQPLIGNDNKDNYRMHDLVHDLAQWVSSASSFQVLDYNSCDPGESCRHIAILCQDVGEVFMKASYNFKRLRTLLLPSNDLKNFSQASVKKLLQSLRYVRALDLSSSTLRELPGCIEDLKLLRHLNLSKTEIEELPDEACNLYNLQTLKLSGCPWLFRLPNNLKNLVNLCHLELDDMFWSKCPTLPPKIGFLRNLQNFHALRVGCETGYGINQLQNLANLKGTLHISNLENAVNAAEANLVKKERLLMIVFEWSNRDVNAQEEATEEIVLEDLKPHANLEELQIRCYKGANLPPWISNGWLENLHTMTLAQCTKCKVLSIGQLQGIRALHIKGMQELEDWQDVECPLLERLTISDCPNLIELPQVMFNLRVLKIKRCSAIKALPVTPALMFLILVDNPNLENWNQKIFRCERVDEQGQRQSWCQYSPMNLIELKIRNCPKLSALPEDFFPQKLEISGCELLTALPTAEHARRFQHLAIEFCNDGTLVKAIPSSNSLYSLVISNITGLISLPKLPQLSGLKTLYIHNCNDLVSLSEGEEDSLQNLTSLTLLSIRGCRNLSILRNAGRFPISLTCLSVGLCSNLGSLGSTDTLSCLTSLKDLYIEDCPLLDSFPDEKLPMSLQHLSIQKCPLLAERCRKNVGPEWPKIMHITDLEIDWNKLPNARAASGSWFRRPLRGQGVSSTRQPLISTDHGN